MKFIKKACLTLLSVASVSGAYAGGMLTNTNQNIAFLRNPAREAAIGIDGVYSNPAGVAFLNDGMHLSLNWQAAFQTRTVFTTSPFLSPARIRQSATRAMLRCLSSHPYRLPTTQENGPSSSTSLSPVAVAHVSLTRVLALSRAPLVVWQQVLPD